MAKHYDFLTINTEGHVVVAKYDTDKEYYNCPGGFKQYYEINSDESSSKNLGYLESYIDDGYSDYF